MKKTELIAMIKEEMKLLNLPKMPNDPPKEPLKTAEQLAKWEKDNPKNSSLDEAFVSLYKKMVTESQFAQTSQNTQQKEAPEQPKPLLPVRKSEFHKLIGQYNEYGKLLKRSGSLREMARKLGALATLAERTVMSETDDWFDAHTVKRNMKELKSYANDFGKYAVEADQVLERVTALYDDMGRVLERYFEIYDVGNSDDK